VELLALKDSPYYKDASAMRTNLPNGTAHNTFAHVSLDTFSDEYRAFLSPAADRHLIPARSSLVKSLAFFLFSFFVPRFLSSPRDSRK
jgi:hypothetical protein